MIDYKKEYQERKNQIENMLEHYLEVKTNYQQKVYKAMRYSLLNGGKRLRGVLALTGGLMAGGSIEKVLPFACAMEMIHAYSLIHDDLPAMDNDDMRRGQPTCHKKFDEATAILAGDALLNSAFELMLYKSLSSPKDTIEAMKIISSASGADGMIGGQMVDLESENKEITYEKLLYLHKLKTGALITGSLLGGYTAMGGDKEKIPALNAYAEKIGLAFQVIDDILDVEGDEKLLGKPVLSDEKNKKNTFITFMGLEGSKDFAEKLSKDASDLVKDMGNEGEFLSQLAFEMCNRKF
ncbi:MAG: polyprenyl synthetase family protein [Clostridia bacterium]|nr:polyprenyl synthetase family protein [Clostridia bacterium]